MSTERHPRGTIIIHWLSAVGIFALVPMGLAMTAMDSADPSRLLLTRLHILIGALTGLLTLARLVLIAKGPRPAPIEMGALHQFGVKATHVVLYLMLFAILGSGLALFGSDDLIPYLSGASAAAPDLGEFPPRLAHGKLPLAYVVVVIAHVAGSLLHEVREGGVLRRIGINRPG